MDNSELKFYSLEQVAELLQVNYQLVYNMVRKGEIPAIRIGKLYRVMEQDFNDYLLQSRTVTSDGITPVICSVCGKQYMSKMSITASCAVCGAPICRTCVELKHAKYCEVHEMNHAETVNM